MGNSIEMCSKIKIPHFITKLKQPCPRNNYDNIKQATNLEHEGTKGEINVAALSTFIGLEHSNLEMTCSHFTIIIPKN